MSRRPQVISLYSGAGGLDYGLEAAGFHTAVAVEMDTACCATLRANRRWSVIQRSIFEVPTREMLGAGGLRRFEVDLVAGGPPCQPFSKAGYWASGDSQRLADPRSGTLGAYMRVVAEALPRAFLLENVEGLAYEGKNEGLALVLSLVEDINRRKGTTYKPHVRVLRAADYGVPQLRNRLFIVAGRDGQDFQFPEPTHADREDYPDSPLAPYHTAWDALGDLTDPAEDLRLHGKWADLLPSIPEGENYLWHTDRRGGHPLFGWRRRYWCFLLKLAKNKPSWTLQAQPGPATGPFHWNNRRLSLRELCRLQTFPEGLSIIGGYGAGHKQIGNAVPSLLAEILGREIRAQILGGRRKSTPLKLIPPSRSRVPPPEPVFPVADKYLHLVGAHAPHPGAGKGHRAGRSSEWRGEARAL